VKAFTQKYKATYGFDVNYLGEAGYTAAQIVLEALQRAGRDLTVDSLINAMETIKDFHDIFGGTYTFSATQHQGTTKAFLSVVHNGRWVPVQDTALAY
jgi:branched-chain amino acid transport system substrate-binding protein